MMFEHEIEELARRLSVHVREIVKQELKPMADAVADLTVEVTATLTDLSGLVTALQADIVLLSNIPADNTAAIEAQVARLKVGSDAAAALLATLVPASPTPAAPAATPPPSTG